jgi:hypothetical protein
MNGLYRPDHPVHTVSFVNQNDPIPTLSPGEFKRHNIRLSHMATAILPSAASVDGYECLFFGETDGHSSPCILVPNENDVIWRLGVPVASALPTQVTVTPDTATLLTYQVYNKVPGTDPVEFAPATGTTTSATVTIAPGTYSSVAILQHVISSVPSERFSFVYSEAEGLSITVTNASTDEEVEAGSNDPFYGKVEVVYGQALGQIASLSAKRVERVYSFNIESPDSATFNYTVTPHLVVSAQHAALLSSDGARFSADIRKIQ